MPRAERAKLADRANEGREKCRYRDGLPPLLTADSAREDVAAWLQWNDPNGVHTDEAALGEDFDPYSLQGAWEAVRSYDDRVVCECGECRACRGA